MRVIALSLFFSILIIFSGCEQDSKDKTTVSNKHTQEILSFITIPNKEQSITVKGKTATFEKKSKITLLYFFGSECFICKKNLPYLERLRERYKEDITIYVFGINENSEDLELSNALAYYSKTLNISFDKDNQKILDILRIHDEIKQSDMPISLLYFNGTFYTTYESITPIEMIEADIKYLLK
ncbi:MAG: redoxin domain-containing protein [Campylobacterales bacterium]|nr:redoxin domain-containing protein [Campylobacterales bacterium]